MSIRWVSNQAGYDAIHEAAAPLVDEQLQKVAQIAEQSSGGEFIVHESEPVSIGKGGTRYRGAVVTGDFQAARMQAATHVLERAVGGDPLVRYVAKSGRVSYITQKQADNYARRSAS